MRVVHKFEIDLADNCGYPRRMDAVQLDANTRVLELTLLSGGEAWEVPSGRKVSVAFRKSDGHGGWYEKLPDGSAACSVSGNVVSAVLAPEVLTCAGKTQVAVVLQDASTLDQIAAFPVTVEVARNPAAGQGISNNYFEYQTMADVNAALGGIRDDIGDMSLLQTSAKDDLVAAINAAARSGGSSGGGLSANAKSLLMTVLRNAVYISDQVEALSDLEIALAESGGTGDTGGESGGSGDTGGDSGGSGGGTEASDDGYVVVTGASATDDGNGNVTVTGLTVTDDGNGNITVS